MDDGDDRGGIDLGMTGLFAGRIVRGKHVQELNVSSTTHINAAGTFARTEHRGITDPATTEAHVYRDRRVVRAFANEARTVARIAAADARRLAPIVPIPKPTHIERATVTCPDCDGRRAFDGEPCPACAGAGVVPAT